MAAKKQGSSVDTFDRNQQKALDGYVEGATVTAACKHAGVSRQTWYNWMKDPVFKAAVEDAEEQVTDSLEQTAKQKANAGDTTLLIFLLKNRRKEKYAERYEVGATVDNNGNAKHLLDARIASVSKRRTKKQDSRKPD